MSVSRHTRLFRPRATRAARPGFTLVELMVVTVVISILAALTFTGLAAARNRSKISKTRSTIRKIHEVIVPHYDTYARRRVSFTPSADRIQNARNKLVAQRLLVVREMPDNWADVVSVNSGTNTTLKTSLPANPTAPMLAYARYRDSIPTLTVGTGRSECLAMIVLKGGVPPQEAESFRADEIGDTDGDGAVEFVDGWGFPIIFVRWPPWQSQGGVDPMDPMRVSGTGVPPNNTPDPVRTPILVSGGGASGGLRLLNGYNSFETGSGWGNDYWYPTSWVKMLRGDRPAWVQAITGTGPTYTTSEMNYYSQVIASGSTAGASFLYQVVSDLDFDLTNLEMSDR